MVFKDCKRCKVYTPNGVPYSEGNVEFGKKEIFIYFENYRLSAAKFRSRVNFFDTQLGLVQTVCLLSVHKNTNLNRAELWMADCQILNVIGIVQRQEDIRVPTNIDLNFHTKAYGAFYGEIKNISAGGAFLETVHPLSKNEIVSFEYTFQTKRRQIQMMTLWVKRLNAGKYGYGCKFVNLSESEEADIRAFVYQRQKEEEEKENNKR